MKFDEYSTHNTYSDTPDIPAAHRNTFQKPSLYRADPFPESDVGKSSYESFQSGVESVLAATKPQKPLTIQEARDRLASLVSQISTINQRIESDKRLHKQAVPEHILVRRKRASRARNILQQEAAQLRVMIQSMTEAEREKTEKEENAARAKSRLEAVWSAYLSAEDVLDEIERIGGVVGALGQKYRKRSRSEVPQSFRDEWQRTHANGVFVQPEVPRGEATEPLKATPASIGERLREWKANDGSGASNASDVHNGQNLVKYTGKKKPPT